jgi:hypothetical protein
LVPANAEEYRKESAEGLIHHIETLWRELAKAGFDLDQLLARSILLPATCALMNPDGDKTVEAAYGCLKELARRLRTTYLHISS